MILTLSTSTLLTAHTKVYFHAVKIVHTVYSRRFKTVNMCLSENGKVTYLTQLCCIKKYLYLPPPSKVRT